MRFKLLVMTVVVLGVLLFGAVVVHARGWSWNSQINVEDNEVHTVWTVDFGKDAEAANDYFAKIVLTLPKEAKVQIISFADNETVVIKRNKKLKCTDGGIEAKATYWVTAVDDATGKHVLVTVTAKPKKGKEVIVGRVSGKVGKTLKLNILIPTKGKVC